MKLVAALVFLLCLVQGLSAGTRYGIFIGKNNGGSKKALLKYAHLDAKQLHATLVEIGNLRTENSILLLEPDIQTLRRNLRKFSGMLAASKETAREVFFYYSGHSDEAGLLIENSVLDFAELKKWIQELPSEVNIVILDSCSSGSLARIKGGKRVPSAVLSESVSHRGTAILASSSFSEDSQESDQLRGSYFTHHLIAGLRGAADLNRDSRVSLYEAYTYSYEETLANTLESRAGPQHPFFDFKVSGYGDLPVSDLKQAGAQLIFGGGIEGKIYIFDNENHLGLKLHKTSTKSLTVRLPPDQFHIRIFQDKSILNADVTLKANERRELEIKHFSPLAVDIQTPVKERYNSDFFLAGVFGPSFHFFMPSAGTLRNIDLADLGITARGMAGFKLKNEIALFLTGAVSGVSNLTKSSATQPLILNVGGGRTLSFPPVGFFYRRLAERRLEPYHRGW
jgi:Caspase domain